LVAAVTSWFTDGCVDDVSLLPRPASYSVSPAYRRSGVLGVELERPPNLCSEKDGANHFPNVSRHELKVDPCNGDSACSRWAAVYVCSAQLVVRAQLVPKLIGEHGHMVLEAEARSEQATCRMQPTTDKCSRPHATDNIRTQHATTIPKADSVRSYRWPLASISTSLQPQIGLTVWFALMALSFRSDLRSGGCTFDFGKAEAEPIVRCRCTDLSGTHAPSVMTRK
jgi:hypothetical protein